MERGSFNPADLAPRIMALVERGEELQRVRDQDGEALRSRALGMLDPQLVRACVRDLRVLLGKSSITEQKGCLRLYRAVKGEGDEGNALGPYPLTALEAP